MPKFYTGTGDKGYTSLLGLANIQKNDPIFNAIGDLDELNSSIGLARFYVHNELVRSELSSIQNDLFMVGAALASVHLKEMPNKAEIGESEVSRLEQKIAEMANTLPELKEFVLPGGCEGSVHLHVARAVARRAERSIVAASERYAGKIDSNVIKYVNRLSSFLFVAALYLNRAEGLEELHPLYKGRK